MAAIVEASDGFENVLRFKHRDPNNRPVVKNGSYRPRNGNSHGKVRVKGKQGDGHRRRSYYTHIIW